jgi:Kef-type K+ transport system membrane component KefB
MTYSGKRLLAIISLIVLLLSVPLIAMEFTTEVNWSLADFLVAALLLTSAGLAVEFALRTLKTKRARWIACGVILFVLCLVWVEMAVGVFGSPIAGN